MNRFVLLENIANGIHAANRIKNLQKATNKSSRSDSPIDSVALIYEILQSVAQYSPQGYRNTLSTTSSRCLEYCNTYKNFKYHMRSNKRSGISKDSFVNSLRILEPVLDDNKKIAIEKIMRIYDLFR